MHFMYMAVGESTVLRERVSQMVALIQFYAHNKYKYALVGLIRAITDSAWCSKSGKIAAAHLEMNVMRFQCADFAQVH